MRASAKISHTACTNLNASKGWKTDFMSIVAFIIYLVVLTAGCAGSWKAALYWSNRTRGPQHEDPRDQEIRELAAALSVSRKAVDSAGVEKKQLEKQIWELSEKLRKTGAAFTNMQQKYNATKETLNEEIEGKSDFDVEISLLRREKDDALARIEELEVQARAAMNGGMVAGLDMLDEDEHALASAHQETNELRAEVEKWKQHCAVMGTTNKALRSQLNKLVDAEKAPARIEAVAAHDDVIADEFPTEASPDTDTHAAKQLSREQDAVSEQGQEITAATDTTPILSQAAAGEGDPEGNPSEDNLDADDGLQRDDLQTIRGVGSKLEQKLNLLGIFSYKEILQLQAADFERANLVIPNLQNRLKKDGWQDQARALHLEKYNELI